MIKDCGINIAGKWRVPGDVLTGKRHTQQEVMSTCVVPPSAPQWPYLGSWCFPGDPWIWSRLCSKHCRSTLWEFLLVVHCWFCFAVIQAQVVAWAGKVARYGTRSGGFVLQKHVVSDGIDVVCENRQNEDDLGVAYFNLCPGSGMVLMFFWGNVEETDP